MLLLLMRIMLLLLLRIMSLLLLRISRDQTAISTTPGDLVVALTQLIQKLLDVTYYPTKWIGAAIEFILNFIALNGGLLGIIWNIITRQVKGPMGMGWRRMGISSGGGGETSEIGSKLVVPLNRDAPNFSRIVGLVDGRTELQVESSEQQHLLEVTVMAAKIAYENAAYIENVVSNVWKFNFVGYYNCWNKFLQLDTTQVFVATDRSQDADLVLVAFRGTEMFNTQDWTTDLDLSRIGLGEMGQVHMGFLKALGLQEVDGEDAMRAFPRDTPADIPSGKIVAYYELRKVLQEQLLKHPRARVVITGYSLGGALAVLFPAVLALHGERYVLDRLAAVHTYGQPRVGNDTFTEFFHARVTGTKHYLRMVYRYDMVPRVPFDAPPVAEFSHGGTCVYYDGWYNGRVLTGKVLDPNYFDPWYALSKYCNAMGDLVKAMLLWVKAGRDYREGAVSLLYRATGMLIPGVASHSLRDYVNAIRLGHIDLKGLN